MYSAIARNKRNTWFIIIIFMVVIAALAWLAGWLTESWWLTAFIILIAAGFATVQYFAASGQALRMAGAQQVSREDAPRYYRLVENLCITTGTPMPKLYVINEQAPNAFATGTKPDNAAITVTTGLFEIMTDRELEGVLGHELGHIRNYDIRVSLIVFGLVVAVGIVADLLMRMAFFSSLRRDSRNNQAQLLFLVFGIVAAIVAPLLAAIVQAAVSRQREYLADATSALTTRDPDGLASALNKLQEHSTVVRKENTSMAHLWIANPLRGGGMSRLFATHPPIADRIERLHDIGRSF